MNITKTMLKAIVLTQLMQSVAEQGRAPTQEETRAVEDLNEELEAAGNLLDDKLIDTEYPALLAAIESLEDTL